MVAGEGGVGEAARETVVMRRLELGFRWVYFNPGKIGVNEMPELRLREGRGPARAVFNTQRRAVNAGSPSCSNVKAGSYWTRSSTLRSSAPVGRHSMAGWPLTSVLVSGRENGRATRVEPDHIAGELEYIRSIYRLNVTREDILGVCGDPVCDLPSDSKIRFIRPSSAIFRFTLKVLTPFDIQYSRSAAAAGRIGFGRRWLSGPADSGARSPHTVPAIRYSSGSSGPNSCPGC